jgi:deoxycytidylate deaminase
LDIDFSKVELYVYRELRNGKMAMSRPCEACMAVIKKMGIKKIHYTTPDGFATEKLTKKIKG